MTLSTAQKIVKFFISSSRFEKIMNESKLYKFDCSCGKQSNIWDIGGVRYKASGKPLTWIKCPYCGKASMKKIYKVNEKIT